MKQIQLSTFPTGLPDNVEVRDFDMGDGRFFRVRMIGHTEDHGHAQFLVLKAQAYEMDAQGLPKLSPWGEPSRSADTRHSMALSALDVSISMDDAWLCPPTPYDPQNPGDVGEEQTKPIYKGQAYGEQVWVEDEQKVYTWVEGFADVTARTKLEDLDRVVRNSRIMSGRPFGARPDAQS